MTTIHTARQMMARNLVLFNTQERLENTIDGVLEPLMTLPRKIQVQRAGGYFKARFEGRSTCCFGHSPREATKNLRFFDGATQ